MKTTILGRGVRACAAAGALGLLALGARAEEPTPYDYPPKAASAVMTPETTIQSWPERSRGAARALIAKYGEPAGFDDRKLVWYKNGPWEKTVVYRRAPGSFLGYRAKDILEQSIAYAVPDSKIAPLKRFDARIRFDKASGRLSTRSDNEKLNYLALNLADEIVTGKRNADEARDFYRRTMALAQAGKTSPYMRKLRFRQR